MEQREYSLNSQSQNVKLKKQIEKKTADLYEVLEQCLDYSSSLNLIDPSFQQSQLASSLESIHNTLREQLKILALQESCYNATLVSLSQNLIKQQIFYDESHQMQVLLKKYEERIAPLRSHLVQKQNQLYYLRKFYFQCFEDEYENCVPSPERLATVQTSFQIKQNILRQCINKGREQSALEAEKMKELETKENHRSICFQQVTNNKFQELYTNIIQVLEEDEQIGQQIYTSGCLANANNNFIGFNKKLKKLGSPSANNNFQTNIKTRQISTSKQKSTNSSFKKSSILLKNKKLKKTSQGSSEKVPNFSKMPRRDYELFRIYHKKIELQHDRHDRLLQQYINYLQVYKVVKKENKQIFKRMSEQYSKCRQNDAGFEQELCQSIQINFQIQSKFDINQLQFDNQQATVDIKEGLKEQLPQQKPHSFVNLEPQGNWEKPSISPTESWASHSNIQKQPKKYTSQLSTKSVQIKVKQDYQKQQTKPCY